MHEIVDIDRLKGKMRAQIHPVILSGGAGTRLWPLSRASFPKQFLPLVSERTLFQETALRNIEDAGFALPIVVCNEEHRFVIDDQLAQINIRPRQILVEPVARNTAPALAIAALWLVAEEPDAVMLVQPSDQAIGAAADLHRAVFAGLSAAKEGRLVVLGIKPTHPETGYGYVAGGRALDGNGAIFAVDRFIEKPDRDTARQLIESERFHWSSGIFLFGAQHYLDELERLHPAMLSACRAALQNGRSDFDFFRLDAAFFEQAPALSIDCAVMERTDRAAVVLADMAWSDISSWQALWETIPRDAAGNVTRGPVFLDSTRNAYIHAEGRLIAAIGLDNIVAVSTDDAILIASADRSGDVAGIVKQLQENDRTEAVQHVTCYRPWGCYKTVDNGHRFQVKRITVKPGAKLSLQKHFHRAEHWVVVQGTALVQRGADTMLVSENQSVYIPVGTEHRLENPGKVPLHLIEVQSGAYLGEDDIVRLADGYGRS